MRNIPFYIVDVFAEGRYTGNQLAVFRSGDAISDSEMQQITKEMNFSETTFVTSETLRHGGFDVRIFTPGEEVPFAGHPTLGTAHIIRTEIQPATKDKIILNLKVGQIPVTFDDTQPDETIYWMKQISPTFGELLTAETIAPVLNLNPSDIDTRFPIEEVSTGLSHILVPLRSLDALKRAKSVSERYFELIANRRAKAILIFCPQPHKPENDISVRMFAEYYGVAEDPATGSGNGCLAGYLARHRYFGKTCIDIRAEQGYEIGRPSLLLLRAEDRDDHIDVAVGGKAMTITRGTLD
ncbi:MAG: PhzF family phenazine biosynthesis protein [Anaerolineales bacterium]|nr:PhzF family phenazine biosynthesis protein [Anaerolineales bacterium]